MEDFKTQEIIEDHKVLAIIAFVLSVLCCNFFALFFAIIAIIRSNDVSKYQILGQQTMAEFSSKRAQMFSWIAIGLIILILAINFTIGFLYAYLDY